MVVSAFRVFHTNTKLAMLALSPHICFLLYYGIYEAKKAVDSSMKYRYKLLAVFLFLPP